MSDFAASWALSRKRFLDEITGLSQEQLNYRIHDQCLTIGEMALHVAGVEVSFGSQLSGQELSTDESRLKLAATEGVVNDQPFPFSADEITPEHVAASLEASRNIAEPLITSADAEVRERELKSALGPMITGEGAFARLGFHAAYHQGQAYLIKTSPGFPG
jgi:hypothetical protein